jgi:hypothetical protein
MAFMPVVIVGGQLLMAVADGIPQVNFEQTCRAAGSEALGINDRFDDCVKAEKRAREQLGTQWSAFDAADRARCGRMATTGGASSYVELLTCLEMEKLAKPLRRRGDKVMIIEPEPSRAPESPPPPVQAARTAPPRVEAAAPPAPPAPLALTPAPRPQNELVESLCRSPLQVVLPACR